MSKLEEIKNKVVEVAKENGWRVITYSDDIDILTYEFSQFSPAGQDFSFDANMNIHDVDSLLDNINQVYNDFDCSQEAYMWLDNTGHGINGAPYDMKDVYEDMEACEQMILRLYNELCDVDWSIYQCRLSLTLTEEQRQELYEHLSRNGYDVYWKDFDIVHINEDEISEVQTILEDREIEYHFL